MTEIVSDSHENLTENKTIQQSMPINKDKEKLFKTKAGIFLASVTGISALIGFGSTLAAVKKKDPSFFNKGIVATREMQESGAFLAVRALGWGTLYAFSGCGLLFYGLWKLSGANNFAEFRLKVGSVLPPISKNNPPQGRTEFEGLNDLLNYISSDEYSKKSKASEHR